MHTPKNWPTCVSCNEPALEGRITCGKATCIARAQRHRMHVLERLTLVDVAEVQAYLEGDPPSKYGLLVYILRRSPTIREKYRTQYGVTVQDFREDNVGYYRTPDGMGAYADAILHDGVKAGLISAQRLHRMGLHYNPDWDGHVNLEDAHGHD